MKKSEFKKMGKHILKIHLTKELPQTLFYRQEANNFVHIELIHLILPNAKIIDIRRNPWIAVLAVTSNFLVLVKGLLFSK